MIEREKKVITVYYRSKLGEDKFGIIIILHVVYEKNLHVYYFGIKYFKK